jgi:hypothetical protein
MSEAQITDLICTPDSAETVRDQVAAILSLELQNQLRLAEEKGIDASGYRIKIYLENGRPYNTEGDAAQTRIINVTLRKTQLEKGGNARLGKQKTEARIFIDCLACGNDSGMFADDRSASKRAWEIARLVRRILMADVYTYLGLRGIVGSRVIVSAESGTTDKTELEKESALYFAVVRIELDVQFLECSIESEGPVMEPVHFEVDAVSGELNTNI